VTLDEALDELYGAPLDEFVAERKRLAQKLGGEEAKELTKLKKPNVAAWVLNQIARRERRDVDLLLDAGHRLRQAQAGVLRGGEKESFEDARRKEADVVKRLTKAAERLLRDARGTASASALAQINESLRAAAITEEGREVLARGRFVEPLRATGFDAFAGIDVPKPKSPARTKAKAESTADERREAADALRELEHRLHAAERQAEKAEKLARAARTDADVLAEEVEAAARRLKKLRG
jgi:hypothetical protein